MATVTDTESESRESVGSLVGGIVQDARELLVQQLTLFQVEIKNDIRRALAAMVPLLAGAVLVIPTIVVLGIGVAELLAFVFPALPLWAAFLIVGGALGFVAAIFVFWGVSSLETISPTPDTALKGLKENLQWKTKK